MSETKMTPRDGFRLPNAKEWLHPASYWEAVAREQRARADAAEARADKAEREAVTDAITIAALRHERDLARDSCAALRAERARIRPAVENLLNRMEVGSPEGWGIWADALRAALAGEETKP